MITFNLANMDILSSIGMKEIRQIGLTILLVTRDLVRKGIALYKSGKNGHIGRFVFIFILNTCGILPIIYLIINKIKK